MLLCCLFLSMYGERNLGWPFIHYIMFLYQLCLDFGTHRKKEYEYFFLF
jgi:hypothetical protein